ncbi:MAG: ABC transporter permease [Candidatus Bipolaricaulia bacterium]
MVLALLKRILLVIPTLIGVATFAFLLMHLSPGDPAMLFFGGTAEGSVNMEAVENVRKALGLDRPLHEQYFLFISRALMLDFGESYRSQRPVLREIGAVAPYSVMLAICGMLVGVLIGVTAGIVAALRRNRALDYIITVTATAGFAAPLFWIAMVLMYLFSYKLRWTPLFGGGSLDNFGSLLVHLTLPSLAVGLRHGAIISRLTRTSMLRVLNADYIRTARAKGVSEGKVVLTHAIRNVLVGLVTIVGYDFAVIIGSSMVTEIVFARPGLGRSLVNAVFARDYAMVQGILIVIGFAIVVVNLLVDMSYALINPQIRYG